MCVLLIGDSGSGKSTLERVLSSRYGFNKVVSYTTREIRDGEIDGIHYNYIPEKEFLNKLDKGFFAEHTTYNGNHYGIVKSDIKNNSIAVVTIEGLRQLSKNKDLNITSFYIDTLEEDRIKYMRERGDSEESILNRLEYDRRVFNGVKYECDYIIANTGSIDDLVYKVLDKVSK